MQPEAQPQVASVKPDTIQFRPMYSKLRESPAKQSPLSDGDKQHMLLNLAVQNQNYIHLLLKLPTVNKTGFSVFKKSLEDEILKRNANVNL
jgi:hypothetical protein